MKMVVVGYDADQEQAFWDVVPVAEPDSVEEAEELAKERFGRLRGDYAVVVDVMTAGHFLEMAARIAASSEEEDEVAYADLEDAANVGEAAGK